jgi:hypothetical protein
VEFATLSLLHGFSVEVIQRNPLCFLWAKYEWLTR